MTASRTRPLAALVAFIGVFSAYGAASVDRAKAPKATAPRPLELTSNALAKTPVPTPRSLFAANGTAAPFVLQASAHDRELAEHCLAQAVYFEAGNQPMEGREAVAQTVINRLRHPDYPKSICGVVYEGADLRTGCQFSFTCDGSMRRPVDPELWSEAVGVAQRALNGFVMSKVGDATYYHADYVRPFWAAALHRITQIGAHIFYRWPGPSGDPSAFTGRYEGHESDLEAIRHDTDPRLATLRPAVLRDATPYRPEGGAAADQRVEPPALRLIEASYVTRDRHHRVMSVVRPAADRAYAAAPAHPVAYAVLGGAPAPAKLAVTTAKISLPPVRVASAAITSAAPVAAALSMPAAAK